MLCQYHVVTHGYAEYILSTDVDMDTQSTEVCCCVGVGHLKHPKPKTSRPEQPVCTAATNHKEDWSPEYSMVPSNDEA